MKYISLIPAYEPDEKLNELVKNLSKEKYETVVVDDGSKSNYKKIFDGCKKYAHVISYEENMGKGYALKTGLKYIKDNYKEPYVVVTMDCDGQHTIKDATKLCKLSEENPNLLITGKRLRSTKTPLRSRMGNGITRFVYRITTGLDVYDTQTGLRAFTNNLMDYMIEIDGNRYEYEMNVLLRCAKDKIKIIETQIETIYIDNNSGSHFNTLKDSAKIYKVIIKFSISSILSFIIDYILYTLFNILTGNLLISNIGARIISATFNYNMNRKVVFNSKKSIKKSALEYFLLAIFILTINTGLLELFVNVIGINKYVAKVIIEIVVFTLSYFIQKIFIFKK